MGRIEFIPLIEPGTRKDKESEMVPSGTFLTNTTEWDVYQEREIRKNYMYFPSPVSRGIYQYRLLDVSLTDIERVISLHIGDTNINESISLFGGYAISKNGAIELYPQCCGLLEEIQLWRRILNDDFEDFYLTEQHPSPLITKRGGEMIIHCQDDWETFLPPTTKEEIRMNYDETKAAFMKMINELTAYSEQLDTLSEKFGTERLSDIMIWGIKATEEHIA